MILNYKVCMQGTYHQQRNIVLQDAYYVKEKDGIIFTAVADGLGSKIYSDIASKVATNYVVNYLYNNYKSNMSDVEILALLKQAYIKSYMQVVKVARRNNHDIEQYDCTLCTAIYDGNNLFFGQSGDSGLIVGLYDGSYDMVTTQQRGEEGNVFSLCFGSEYWEFSKVSNVASFILLTEGLLEQFIPPILAEEQVKLNINFVDMFLNHYDLNKKEIKQLEKQYNLYLNDYSSKRCNDDRTLLCFINTSCNVLRKEETYYKPIDWKFIQEKLSKYIKHKYFIDGIEVKMPDKPFDFTEKFNDATKEILKNSNDEEIEF